MLDIWLQLLQLDVFWGADNAPSIWPWSYLDDYVRMALTTRYFAFDDMVVCQLAEIKWRVRQHDVIQFRELVRNRDALTVIPFRSPESSSEEEEELS